MAVNLNQRRPRAPAYKPQMQNLINRGKIAYKPVANLGYKKPAWQTKNFNAGVKPIGYDGPGVQNSLNSGLLPWSPSLGGLGYTRPQSLQNVGGAGQGGSGGYGGMIGGDWEVQQAEAAMAARMASLRGDFQKGIRQGLIDTGISDTTKLGSLGKYIDADTIKAAIANKYSQTAVIGQQAERSRAGNNAQLAARGILSSGQTTKAQADVSAGAEQGRYQALRDFLGQGEAGLRGIADEEYGMAQGLAAARANAAARAADMYGYMGDEGGGQQAATMSGGSYRAPLRQGYRYGTSGQYMTRNRFQQAKPKGNYQNYLSYLKRSRGGKL